MADPREQTLSIAEALFVALVMGDRDRAKAVVEAFEDLEISDLCVLVSAADYTLRTEQWRRAGAAGRKVFG